MRHSRARVLSGERPENIPVVHASATKSVWIGGSFSDGTSLSRRCPRAADPVPRADVWERDKKYIIPAIADFPQALLIAGLLRQRARNRKAETVLRESEKRFRKMADTTPSLVWMCDEEGKVTYLNERRVAFTGQNPMRDTVTHGRSMFTRKTIKNIVAQMQGLKTRDAFSLEYRLRRSDGVYRWMFDVASPRVNADGSFGGFIGSAIDITDQKLAQQALEKVSGQLIEAQEKERRRIARDLHDDIAKGLHYCRWSSIRRTVISADRRSRLRKEPASIFANIVPKSRVMFSVVAPIALIKTGLPGHRVSYTRIRGGVLQATQVNIEFSHRNAPMTCQRMSHFAFSGLCRKRYTML